MADVENMPAQGEAPSETKEQPTSVVEDAAEELPPDGSSIQDATAPELEAVLEDSDDSTTDPEPHQTEQASVVETPTVLVNPPDAPNGSPATASGPPTTTATTDSRSRTDSSSTAATTEGQRPSIRSSLVFVVGALEHISASKDAQRKKELRDAAQYALDTIKAKGDPTQIDPRVLLEPLRLATDATTESVITTALDCIGKLISYSYFSVPFEQQPSEQAPDSLIDQAIDTICDCFEGEATPDRVQLQIIISLLAAVLNDKVVVHGAGLLKAVRLIYNIFLHSKNARNQQVAQGTLAQMVGTVFERAKTRIAAKEARLSLAKISSANDDTASTDGAPYSRTSLNERPSTAEAEDDDNEEPRDVPVEKDNEAKMTLQTFERRGSFDEDKLKEGPTMVTKARGRTTSGSSAANRHPSDTQSSPEFSEEDDEDEVYMKDAFLVFRAMCKISIKSLRPDELADLRSQGMRTKLLSLHIIHMILFNHTNLFLSPLATIRSSSSADPTPFIQAVKQLLCQSLSRNGASSVSRVFEVGSEIFFLMLKHLRVMLKKEVEVFLKEIYLAILENRNAPIFQKQCFLNVLSRIATDQRALVEIYLNYDCDRTATDNMFQRIVEHLSKMASTPVAITSIQQHAYSSREQKSKLSLADWQLAGTVPPSLSTTNMVNPVEQDLGYPKEYAIKQQSIECLVDVLRSLVHWAQQGVVAAPAGGPEAESKSSDDNARESTEIRHSGANNLASPYLTDAATPPVPGTPLLEDDPRALEQAKQKKTAFQDAIRQFNFKPKRGIRVIVDRGLVESNTPQDIAQFLFNNDRINKAALGEFLGEGDAENIAIMHAFVDSMDFNRTRFVDALRTFLQSFRLPGEAQKIDRFMLKFAERYILGNPNAFANADTAYVLAYSVIMLNTDQHSSKMKGRRMTPEDFIKNNRGINDNQDLPDEYLRSIYDEIAHNEIVLDTERETAANLGQLPQPVRGRLTGNIGQAFANAGRDLEREASFQRSEKMSNKTEQLFKDLIKAQRRGSVRGIEVKYIPASSYRHVGPMFEVTWMPFLTALSGSAQDTNNLETVRLCLDGLKLAIQIACFFDLENPRMAFVASIAKFTNLYNLSEMQAKNVEALRVLLDVAHTEGNLLKGSWREILTCVSQLDRFQLISHFGVDERSVPDMTKMQPGRNGGGRKGVSLQVPDRSRGRQGFNNTAYRSEIAEESMSAGIVNGVDRIFSGTSKLSGDAIVHFVKALTQVSWQEIQSSGNSQDPRTFSLQKLVEVGEYNMSRVRFEWTSIWQVLGEHFNQVGCHTNVKVVHFALNSLRQLSIRFLELEELPGFKFQKDFLKPFEHIISNASVIQVKEIVLHSLISMIQALGDNIRSGWRTIFGVFTVAGRERFEGVVNLAFDHVNQLYNERLGVIMMQGAFADLIVCLTEFSKNVRFQKKSLQAIETLKSTIPRMLKAPESPFSVQSTATVKQPTRQTQEEQFWFPILFAFHDVLMTGEDLEVRSRALNYLFDALIKYGKEFPRDFWDTIWRQLLYPIFMVLKSKSEMSKVVNHEELSVWLSTTMIQALRNMMSLFTHYFDSLEYMLDRFLDLLALCICQENDTLARIGSNCLQTLILQNVEKFTPQHWSQIVSAFIDLFARTEASGLFSAATGSYGASTATNGVMSPGSETPVVPNDLQLTDQHSETSEVKPSLTRSSTNHSDMANGEKVTSNASGSAEPNAQALEDFRPDSSHQQAPVVVTAARRRFFNQIITKCVLQLLMIETVNELFSNDSVYARIPSSELLRLMALLKKSYHFAKRFNDDIELRNRLFHEGFMKQPPNLLKQESGSASVYVSILFRMYHDEGAERRSSRAQTEAALIPLCLDIIRSYIQLNAETQQRNIVTWRPVVIEVIEGYANFQSDDFSRHAQRFAPLAIALMSRDMGMDLQRAVQAFMQRLLELHYDMPPINTQPPTPTPTSPKADVFGGRKTSRSSVTPR